MISTFILEIRDDVLLKCYIVIWLCLGYYYFRAEKLASFYYSYSFSIFFIMLSFIKWPVILLDHHEFIIEINDVRRYLAIT